MAEWLRALIIHYCTSPIDHLTAVSGVGSSHALATCETSQILLAGVPGGFSRFCPPQKKKKKKDQSKAGVVYMIQNQHL